MNDLEQKEQELWQSCCKQNETHYAKQYDDSCGAKADPIIRQFYFRLWNYWRVKAEQS